MKPHFDAAWSFAFAFLGKIVLASLCMATFCQALAITRIGNAKFGSEKLGFEGSLEKPFVYLREEPNDGALFISMGDGFLRDGEPLSINPLSRALPGIEDLTRSEFKTLFNPSQRLPLGWTSIDAHDACVEAFVSPSLDGQNHWGLASWGEGKGVVFYGSNKSSVGEAISKMLQTLVVKQGACAWQ
jgi:hypothetical protein